MHRTLLAVLVASLTCEVCTAAPLTFTKLWKGEELWPFGGGQYKGSGDPKDWRSMPGATLSFRYPGTGKLPEPVELVVPIGQTLPLGTYRLFVKNFYRGEMQATLGDITKPLRIVRYDWTVGETFEINQATDKIVLRYFPSGIVADTGAAQEQNYIVQGVFLTTESSRVPVRGGEIVEVLPDVQPDSEPGNYLTNASFEVGLCGWGKQFQTSDVYGPENLDGSTAAHGQHSVQVKLAVAGKFGFESEMLRLPSNRTYALSFFAKSDRPLSVRAAVRGMTEDLRNYADGGLSATATVGTGWQRFSAVGTLKPLPGALYALMFEATSDQPTTLWLDAVQLQEGGVTDFTPRRSTEVGYVSRTPGNIMYDDEPAEIELRVTSSERRAEVPVVFQVVDLWGSEVHRGETQVPLAGGQGQKVLRLFTGQRGIFRVLFTAEGAGAQMVYSVLPRNPHLGEKYPQGTLGADAHFAAQNLTILKRANFNWVSSKHLGRWYLVQPEKERYAFRDEDLRIADRAGMSVLMQFLNPGWGTQAWLAPVLKPEGGAPWPPAHRDAYLRAWAEFIQHTVTRYKPWVRHWEIENEPNCVFTPEEYGQVLKTAYQAVKRADPQAQVVGFAGGGFSAEWYQRAIQSMGAESCDVFSCHFYGSERATHAAFAEFLKQHGRPGWNTEVGSTCPTFFTHLLDFESLRQKDYWSDLQRTVRDNVVQDVRTYLTTLSIGGMEKHFYYFARFANCSPSQPTRWFGGGKELVEYDGSLRANAVGLSIASHFLDGAKYHGRVPIGDSLEAHVYEKGTGSVGFLWAQPGQPTSFVLPDHGSIALYDLMGNPVSATPARVEEAPIYFTSEDEVSTCGRWLQAAVARNRSP